MKDEENTFEHYLQLSNPLNNIHCSTFIDLKNTHYNNLIIFNTFWKLNKCIKLCCLLSQQQQMDFKTYKW